MEFLVRAPGSPRRVGLLAGSFHPVTRAHEALARAGLAQVDEVVFVMPRRLPHKEYAGVGLEARMALVKRVAETMAGLSAAITTGGLFVEMAAEARRAYGARVDVWFLCGRDAAERMIGWDYQSGQPAAAQLEQFGLLVGDRHGRFEAPAPLRERVRRLELPGDWDEVSATEVRRRIAARENWPELVPAVVADEVRRLYGAAD